ncbi:thioesterase family protein [Prauserella endophytica]|uniref:Thioesterase family protein n=1 Tax=Prauserella endophytica TaxID=1592324 RepID=A0ABY2S625_9PSEU|nr:thioesterase family protein [Prauserella endophytica]TKG70739.1 thioesterase family protein [Prauserella endophytica]
MSTPSRHALDHFLTLTPSGDGWAVDVPPAWTPAGAAHGGVLFGMAVTAMGRRALHPDLLTATAHFLRPTMPGAAHVTAEVLRSGRAHATTQATLSQDGKETVRVLAVFGTLPPGPPDTELKPPILPPPQECVQVHGAPPGDGPPDYPSTLDVRIHPDVGWPHGRPSGRAEVTGWARMSDDRPHDDASLAVLADGFPPAIFDALPVAHVPTLELTVHVRAKPSSSWLAGRFTTRVVNEPYLEEDGLLWDESGRLVVMSRQLALADANSARRL